MLRNGGLLLDPCTGVRMKRRVLQGGWCHVALDANTCCLVCTLGQSSSNCLALVGICTTHLIWSCSPWEGGRLPATLHLVQNMSPQVGGLLPMGSSDSL